MNLVRTTIAIALSGLLLPHVAFAQSAPKPFEVAGQLTTVRSSEFDSTDVGIGGRLAWHPSRLLGVEAELSVFPSDFPRDNGFSSGLVEGLFGATVGPTIGRIRPFASFRPGFARFKEASEPQACVLIFPPPLSCELSAGRTLFALEYGGGVEVNATPQTFIRINLGDRMLRYPGPVSTSDGTHDGSFFGHDFRFAASAGWRF